MTNSGSRPSESGRLSAAQRDLLAALDGYYMHQGHVRPSARRTIEVLRRLGLVRDIGQHWYEVTDAGREALR